MKTKQEKPSPSTLEKKWSKELMAAGWTVLPSVIIERQNAIGLDAVDVNILMHLAMHWWSSDNLPYPSKAKMATCMGVSQSTIRRHIAKMEQAGFIKRIRRTDKYGGQQTNFYSFEGLINEAKPFAEELVEEKLQREKAISARVKRKRILKKGDQ